ncbi:hypothetical protein TH53_17035 [Pedobacter lusitanus]|uniref:tRNA threonylcarbamoyladenosine biosynthesis protein TsaE n=1 Tax=Pedobacter lusitanus TaxID=1503925 RepID=A0A0D0FUA0_9SPHI|nr:tRNA (adenosine(37)-N6)-threonylcarbamoyltransferase complex ATPase subunit type 1 TsaE [Pedobacter lusitanus]KIO76039.1 hypothetical protein TH53_17035 [Pedobacter lusitanus]
MNIEINHPEKLGTAAEALLGFAGNEKIFAFEGEMGAGKTTFIKAFCEKLGVRDVVNSPTFSIVNEYAADGQVIYHFDFYRIKNLQEVFDIGYEEYFYSGNICLIEWPEKIRELMPENYIEVEITVLSEMHRSFSFTRI